MRARPAHWPVDQPAPTTLPGVLLLTDRLQLRHGRGLVSTLSECVGAGLSHVVLRELDLPVAERAALVTALAATGAQVIAAHGPLPGTVGVHLPSQPVPGPACPDTAAPDHAPAALRGRSCHSRAEVERAAADGFDYATLSPYAVTDSKPGYGPPLPAGAFRGLPIPTFALGGITPDNAAAAMAEGAYGVAVMGAVMRAVDPAAVTAALVAATRTGRAA